MNGQSKPIRVAVCGARGRMGQEMIAGLGHDPELTIVGGCDPRPADDTQPELELRVAPSLGELLDAIQADVAVDFTTADAARSNAQTALAHGVPIVIGTTGLSKHDLDEIDAS
ncbi:MAG: 4-hydroxy-tetrahydrodipicolinate reductase, partial [Chloroflexota bacterium]|nr:4-hydroxy-tetrahydrodipicolinate reductase [Chloroflexota bacterium]